ncbi:cation diffusion facilitator family transporter [Falsiroseomonas selenitidurans]|uniref:Cation transporter n=1 Tax=Falsiroseomonas selenitidurans TaxID=2716335 RepID=A0ABX1EFC2_9PROT|nr:cation diffusion facilitator family transporter [Falsiroseomonas selenitidurans]NKC34222.1 cation transporter [Falsiroseomonas selenitidurans]
MPHDHHDHPHGHHHHAPSPGATLDSAFRWGVGLNLGYTLAEAMAGFWFGSLALLADAAHNLTDVAGLLIAWVAVVAARRPPNARHTYGLGRGTILAALANALAILIGVGAVVWEAVGRLSAPPEVPGLPVLLVAAVGIGINLGTALLFRGHGHDLNARGAWLHMATDAAVSLGVVVSAAIILATGWQVADPLAALLVSVAIAWAAAPLLRDALHLAMDGVPRGVDASAVRAFLAAQPGVAAVHDLHIRAPSTTVVELTAHLVMPGGHPGDAFLDRLAAALAAQHGIGRATLQIELGDGPACRLAAA